MGLFIKPDPLTAGFFSVKATATLLNIRPQTVRGWADGYANSNSGPVINRDFASSQTISFLDLMELRFIEHFRAQRVSMNTIRLAAQRARNEWNVTHPFALSKARYLTDRKKIFAQIARDNDDKPTWDMASGQHEIWEVIESRIAKDVEFDPKTELATLWRPRSEFPNVVVDPRFAFGRPIIAERHVPTSALFRQFKADGSKSAVAEWFGVSEHDVETAVNFELSVAA
jgi:uncharacterized protein (DUF433 family)